MAGATSGATGATWHVLDRMRTDVAGLPRLIHIRIVNVIWDEQALTTYYYSFVTVESSTGGCRMQGRYIMTRPGLFRRFASDRGGAVAFILALSTPFLIGGVGMTADVIQWTYMKRAMQRQADSGALAGAFAVSQQQDVAATVTADLARNSNVNLTSGR